MRNNEQTTPIILDDDHSEEDDVWVIPDLSEDDLKRLADELFDNACDPEDSQLWQDPPPPPEQLT